MNKRYTTYILPQYVKRYLGTFTSIIMEKVGTETFVFRGDKNEVVVHAKTSDGARRAVSEKVAEILNLHDHRLRRFKT